MCVWGARPRGCVGSSQHAVLARVLPIPIQGSTSPFGGEAPPQKPGGAGGLLPGAQWGWSVGWVLAGVAGWEPRGFLVDRLGGGSGQIPCFRRRVSKARSAPLPFGDGEGRWMRRTAASPARSSPRPLGPGSGRLPEKGPRRPCPQSRLHSMAWDSGPHHAEPLLGPGVPAALGTLAALRTYRCDMTVLCPSGPRAVLPGGPAGPGVLRCSQGSRLRHPRGPPSPG